MNFIDDQKIKIQLEGKTISYVSENCSISDGIVSVNDDLVAYIVYN